MFCCVCSHFTLLTITLLWGNNNIRNTKLFSWIYSILHIFLLRLSSTLWPLSQSPFKLVANHFLFCECVCGAIEWNTVTFALFYSFYPFFAAHLWFVIVVVCFIILCFSVAVWVCSLAMCASMSFTWVFHFWNTFNGAWQKTLHYTYIHWNVNRLTHSL